MGIHRELVFHLLPLPSRSWGYQLPWAGLWRYLCAGSPFSPVPLGTALGRGTMKGGSRVVRDPGPVPSYRRGNKPLCTGDEISHV